MKKKEKEKQNEKTEIRERRGHKATRKKMRETRQRKGEIQNRFYLRNEKP